MANAESGDRANKRRHLIFNLRIIDALSGHDLGHLGDITEDGLLIVSAKKLETGRTLKIKIFLPKSAEFAKESIELAIQTLWSKPDVNPELTATGCKIVEATAEERIIILDLIQLQSFSD